MAAACSGDARNRLRRLRRADAEADANRQLGMALEARHGFLNMLERRRTGTGHAGHRDVIDEAGAAVEYHRKALVIGGRGGQADEVDARGLGRVAEVFVVLRRQVDHDHAAVIGEFARGRPLDAGIGSELGEIGGLGFGKGRDQAARDFVQQETARLPDDRFPD